jgi:hypothetical protein
MEINGNKNTVQKRKFVTSVVDPDPKDPYAFEPSGSRSDIIFVRIRKN